jgi:hypothetical protein
VTGTAWEQRREALRAIVSVPLPGTAVSRAPGEGAAREALARRLRHPPARPAPASLDDSIL